MPLEHHPYGEWSHALLSGLLADDAALAFVRSVPDGQMLLVSTRYDALMDPTGQGLTGRFMREFLPPDVAEEHAQADAAVVADDTARTIHATVPDRDGVEREFFTHKFPVRDAAGVPYAVGAVCIDVSAEQAERRAAVEARLDSEARFRAVFENAPIGQIFTSVVGIVTSVNESMADMLGMKAEDMVGRPVRDFVIADEWPMIRETAAALLAGEAKTISEVRRYRHRTGSPVPVRVTSALLRDTSGEPRWWVSLAADLTTEERTRAELELAHETALRSAARLRLLHSIATAANEASSVGDLADRLLESVCGHFHWSGGALLRWPPDAAEPVVLNGFAVTEDRFGALLPPRLRMVSVQRLPEGSTVVVPLVAGGIERLALAFDATETALDEDQTELLTLIGIEIARVVERDASAQRLRASENRFRSVFDASPLPMGLTLGQTGTYGLVNDALCKMLGRTPDDLIGHSAKDICHPEDVHLTDPAGAAAAESPDGRHTFELRLLHSSGRVIDTMITLAWISGPDGSRQLLAQMEDVTARRTVEYVLRQQAEEDNLTGLANRTRLGRALTELGARAQRCAVLFIDLDGFKLINDTRGHDVGDEVLIEVARRLRAVVRPDDIVARFGGDEFVVLCASSDNEAVTAPLVAERIEVMLADPIFTRSGPAAVTASIGIATGIVNADTPQELVRRADAAMYHAKRRGRDRSEFYDLRLHERALEHQRTEGALRTALEDDRFTIHYQPIVALEDERIVGFEALVRLIDSSGALVPPDRFIAVAEQSGLIVPMGTWVLHESCRMLARLRAMTGTPLTVSVNIAARQAARADLADTVLAALDESGLPEDALTLELTESALLEADDATLAQLTMLRDKGVVIGLDDFGTGYSSLTYLQRFPVSHLKVDRSFVSGMVTVPGDQAIVRAVTRLASDLGLEWVAEGVETCEQRAALRELGPGFAQGYLFSRPVPADQLPGLLGVDVRQPA